MLIKLHSYQIQEALAQYIQRQLQTKIDFSNNYVEMTIHHKTCKSLKNGGFDSSNVIDEKRFSFCVDEQNTETEIDFFIEVVESEEK